MSPDCQQSGLGDARACVVIPELEKSLQVCEDVAFSSSLADSA